MEDKTLGRPTRDTKKTGFFDIAPDWRDDWWGMPSFEMEDATPIRKITVNFQTEEDVEAFAKTTGLPITLRSDSVWFPYQTPLHGEYEWQGPPMGSRYPICIPSKGRAACQRTGLYLDELGVPYHFFVEDTEVGAYSDALGKDKVVVLPFHDLGQGSIPARNFIWEWAKERGHARHWVVDDNLKAFTRLTNNRRLIVRGGGFFRAMEDFVDRYENIALAGPHASGFVTDRQPEQKALQWNRRIYSCILIDTSLPFRWRGRYNEDTDLSIRVMKAGYCTLLFQALLMNKLPTVGVHNEKALPGGNTDNVYNTGDHRRAFAESLQKQHPDVVRVVWKFNRWHHEVNYGPFKKNKPILKAGIVPTKHTDDYGMKLVRVAKRSGPEE